MTEWDLEFAARGANVVINVRSNPGEAGSVAREGEQLGGDALVVLGEVADCSAPILPKTDVGAVRLGINAEAAAATFDEIVGEVSAHTDAEIEGVVVSPMRGRGLDTAESTG
jgi:NAD(P)-dependent dehydrogenase (short-subunit alcohol dehydrogenase family)